MDAGHDAVDVRGLGMSGASDREVHARALAEERALVTADLGLANVYRYAARTGTVLVRLPIATRASELSRRVADALSDVEADDLRGAVMVIEPGRVRVRRHG